MGQGFVALIASLLVGCSDNELSKQGVVRFTLDDSTFVILPTGPVVEGGDVAIYNGDETIVLSLVSRGVYSVPVFNGSFVGEWRDGGFYGAWTDSLRSKNYSLPVEFYSVPSPLPVCLEEPNQVSWNTSIGLLVAREFCDYLSATFITPTGDYRYLSGSIKEGAMELSTFDGAHLFHFSARVVGDSLLDGVFKSGGRYAEAWSGGLSNKEPAAHPSVRLPKKDQIIEFSAKTLEGGGVAYSQKLMKEGGVDLMVVDVLGSWCPNCMDELRLIKSIKQDYPEVLFVSIAFERGGEAVALERLRGFKSEMWLDWAVLYGGVASKSVADSTLPFLGGVTSFPTTAFIPAEGEPIIHTGFNGPATGPFYEKEVAFFLSTIEGFIE